MKKKERKGKRERANSKNRNLQVEIFAFFSSFFFFFFFFPFLSFLIPPVPSLRFSFSLTRSYITGGCSDRLVVEWLTCLLMLTNCSSFLNSAGDCGPYTCTSGAACHLINGSHLCVCPIGLTGPSCTESKRKACTVTGW